MTTSSNYPSDDVLLTAYLAFVDPPDNEPVGTWIDEIYWYKLWVVAKGRLRNDHHRAEDALHDTALRMCGWTVTERPSKFTIDPDEVEPKLVFGVLNSCRDIYRRKGYTNEPTHAPVDLPPAADDDADLQDILLMETRREQVKEYFLTRGMELEAEVAEIIFIHKRKARAFLMEQKGWSKEETHRVITRVKRHLRKLRINDR